MEPVVVGVSNLTNDQIWAKAKNFANQLKREKAGLVSDLSETYNDQSRTAVISGKAFGCSATFGVAVVNQEIAIALINSSFGFGLVESKVRMVLDQNLRKLFA